MSKSEAFSAHRWDHRDGAMRRTGAALPASIKSLFERPVLGLAAYSAALIAVYLLVELCLDATSAIPFAAYSSQFVLLSALPYFGWTSRILLLVFALVMVLLDPAKLRWSDFNGGATLRWAVVILACSMVWPFTTYGYNYAADAGHLIDRGLLLLSLILLVWRPVFALPLLLLAYIIFAQLTAPTLGGSVLAHKTQVLRVIELFVAFYFVRLLIGYHRTSGYLFVVGCYVAVAYWLPAWAKFQLDWLSGNDLNLVPMAAYAHGWRGALDPQAVVELGAKLQSTSPLFKVIAFSVEAAFVLFFLRYRMALLLLAAAIIFHLGVFYLFGFLFWTWITLDVVLIALLVANHRSGSGESVFGVKYVPLAIVLIVAGGYWAKPPALAWYDTPLTYTYKVNATMDNGEVIQLNPRFFAPYEDAFTMTGFNYLVQEHGVLVGPYGVTNDTAMFQRISAASTFDEILKLEQSQTWQSYNQERAARFYQFLEQFVRNRNQRGDVQQSLYRLHSPVQFWSNREGLIKLGERKITSVTVVENTHYFDGETLAMVRQLPLRTIDVSKEPQS